MQRRFPPPPVDDDLVGIRGNHGDLDHVRIIRLNGEGSVDNMKDDVCFRTATELRGLIASRQLSCREVVDAHIARIEAVDPALNAIPTEAFEFGRDCADDLDRRGDLEAPLAGLPIAHKDLVATRGIRTTYGSPLYAEHVPTVDDRIIVRMRRAGAVTIGKSNAPEFGAGSQTFNRVFGVTRNPYDLGKTCGGSSGGAAVALAARLIPIADGSDTGGIAAEPRGVLQRDRVPAFAGPRTWRRPMVRPVYGRSDGAHGGRRGVAVLGSRGSG